MDCQSLKEMLFGAQGIDGQHRQNILIFFLFLQECLLSIFQKFLSFYQSDTMAELSIQTGIPLGSDEY